MAYCTKCGKEIKEGSTFCSGCGTKQTQNNNSKKIAPIDKSISATSTKKTGKGKLVLVGIVAIAILFLLMGKKSGSGIGRSKNIDLKDCVTITASGYETVGKATYAIDDQKVRKKLIKANPDLEGSETINHMIDSLKVTLSKVDHLSNGDKIEISLATNNKEIYGNNNLEFKVQSWDYKIDTLDKVLEIDPFADDFMEIEFERWAPFLDIKVHQKVRNEYGINVTYDITQDTDASNFLALGDTYTISIREPYSYEDFTEQHGIVYTRTEIQKTVKKGEVPFRIDSIKDLTDDQVEQLKAHARSEINNYISSNSEWVESSKLEYEGAVVAHLTNPKNGDTSKTLMILNQFTLPLNYIENYNDTILVFSTEVIDTDGKKHTFYFPEHFAYVTAYPDGEFDYSVVGLEFNQYISSEYNDLKSLKNAIKETYQEGYYTLEMSGKLK